MGRKKPAYQRRLVLSLWTATGELKVVRPSSIAAFLDGSKRSVFFETNRVDIIAGEGKGSGEMELTDVQTETCSNSSCRCELSKENTVLGRGRLRCCL